MWQHNQDGGPLQSLLFVLKKRKPGSLVKSVVNRTTIDLAHKLLFMKDYVNLACQLTDVSDVKALLDFMLYLLLNGYLSNTDARLDATRRARRFMFKVITKTPVIPGSLFVTGVSMNIHHEIIGGGGFGLVFKGRLGRTPVALKVLYKTHNNDDFCREALMWRSLNHQFVLPFLGVHETESTSQLFLVSPYMNNGTLAQWRKKANRSTAEIEKLISEVAEGVEYIHSEGVVHGDLRGDNVLLDAQFHVKITDFGLTRYSESTPTLSGWLHCNFLAPELFGILAEGNSASDDYAQSTARTQKSDVYAFGCLYYEIQFDTIPFAGAKDVQIMRFVSRGELPSRLDEPPLSNGAWELIQWCWARDGAKRPAMTDVLERMTKWAWGRQISSEMSHDTPSPLAKSKGMNIANRTIQAITSSDIFNKFLPANFSYAVPLIKWSNSTVIDDRDPGAHLTKMLGDYGRNDRNSSPEDQDKINRAMVKIFYKMTTSQDPSAGANDLYYKCVNNSVTRHFDVSPEVVYDRLLRSTDLRIHPRGISTLAFAFAAILALSLHRECTPKANLKYNKTSPSFDLSPLYGSNEIETNSIRMEDGRGMLWPDSFAEDRLDMLPDSIPVLLVLWNRYHNYVAEHLLSHNEDHQWADPDNLTSEECLRQDNEIFHVARSITCIQFINVVREDFFKGLVGMPVVGSSTQADILFDRGVWNDRAGCFSSIESYLLYSFSSFAPGSLESEVLERFEQSEASADPDMRRRSEVGKLCRNKHGQFEDNGLAELLLDAIESNAGCPGGWAVPDYAREQEIQKMKNARQANVCTLNEFRQHLCLKPLESFEEWNPEFANMGRDLYHDIDNLELYPGLLCERSYGYGFGFGYTMTWGLIADIVTRIRSDPVFTSNFQEHVLTKWGYEECTSSNDDRSESMLRKLFQRTLPYNFLTNSYNVYYLFPFVIPGESKACIERHAHVDQKKYMFDRPKSLTVLSSLLALLKTEPMAPISSNINTWTVGLMYKLLGLKDYGTISSQLNLASDVELLLDAILYVIDNDCLPKRVIPSITRKARRLMFTLLAQMPVAPKSLFISGVSAPDLNHDCVDMGGFGYVFKGKYKGKYVALKMLYKGVRGNDSLKRDFCREVMAWRSLSHRYILPLLGIFEMGSQIFLVSPFMENGTLASWRKKQQPNVKDIRQRILEVAEALLYIHSEGIVHGDLRGENVLLDASFHSQVADFGLTRHSDMITTHSTATFAFNFAAPELLGMCSTCGQGDCLGCGEGGMSQRRKTHQTDIYAFGCLYYQIYFNTAPFAESSQFQIMKQLTAGVRPERLERPRMEANDWNLIQRCWASKPSVRPNVEDVVKMMT